MISDSEPIGAEAKDSVLFFKSAYNNRYTWEPDFKGYCGTCSWKSNQDFVKGDFYIGTDLKPKVTGVLDDSISKLISSQLWEVAIHRVRRSFDNVHSGNHFTYGDTNELGKEILVGGKNNGDKYRIKDNVITMVYRHIHGSLINIYTKEVINTGKGYLSKSYTSQYLDPESGIPIKGKSHFEDDFIPLYQGGPWVLGKRSIKLEIHHDQPSRHDEFIFSNLKAI